MTALGIPVGGEPAADAAYCEAILPRVSRTFALSIENLPEGLREAVRVAYLLCRVVDTIEDEPGLGAHRRQRLFDSFETQLERDDAVAERFELECIGLDGGDDGADGELCRRAGAVFRTFRRLSEAEKRAIRPHVMEMSRGMRLYAARADARGGLRIRDFDDLERYCYFVAGTVGELLTTLFEQRVPELPHDTRKALRARSVSFGLGLQMVNVLKDVAADHSQGRCYLPQTLALRQGVTIERLLEPERRSAAMAVVRAVSQRTREHLIRAREYTLLWPLPQASEVRLFCAVPLALAFATLRVIEAGDGVLTAGVTPKISREATTEILAQARAAAGDGARLEGFLAAYAEPQGG